MFFVKTRVESGISGELSATLILRAGRYPGAPCLRFVELGIGPAQKTDDVVAAVKLNQAGRESDPHLSQFVSDLVKLGSRCVGCSVRKDADELITTVAEHQILTPKT